MDIDRIESLLLAYIDRHPLAIECGSEYIGQSDEAQIDAIQLVCDIFDALIP